MSDSYFSETLRDLIRGHYIVLAIIAAIFIEFIMIVEESYVDFPTPVSSIQLYFIVIIIVSVIYHFIWSVQYTRIFNILLRTFIFIMPIGLIVAYYDGYTNDTLMNFEWLFTHDMVYVIAVSQVVVLMILMIGLKDYKVIHGGKTKSMREKEDEVMSSEFEE